MQTASKDLQGQWDVSRIPLGAGGYIIGFDFSADGSRMMCWADVFGCYVRDKEDDRWHSVFTATSLPLADFADSAMNRAKSLSPGIGGTLQGRIAPSNHDRLYASLNGWMYRVDISSDGRGGKTIRASRFTMQPQVFAANTGVQRLMAHGVDVDPHDDQVVIFGTSGSGVYYTHDGGHTVHAVEGIAPVAPTKRYLVGIDPYDPRHIYIQAQGVGLYHSASGVSGHFLPVQGGPTTVAEMLWLPDGTLWMSSADSKIWRIGRETAPESIVVPGAQYSWGLAIDPANHDHIVVWDLPKQGMIVSTDRGAHWTGVFATARPRYNVAAGGEVQWFQNASPHNWHASRIMFDPVVRGRLWMAHGLGIGFTDNVPAADIAPPIAWTDHSAGIEELVSMAHYVNPVTGTALGLFMDQPIWRYNAFDAGYANTPRAPFRNREYDAGNAPQGSCADSAIDDPEFMVASVGLNNNRMCFSRDDGRTWIEYQGPVPVAGLPPGGCIAVSNSNNVIFVPANNGPAVFTLDGTNPDAAWHFIKLGDVQPVDHLVSATWNLRHIVTADKTRAGTFALVMPNLDPNNKISQSLAGLWITRDGGATWTRSVAGVIGLASTMPGGVPRQDNRQYGRAKLAYIPGFAGELLYSPHNDDVGSPDDRFFWVKDDGNGKIQALRPGEITKLRWFDFGHAAPGQTRPAVYFYATIKNVRGYYASFDWFASTPRLLVPDYPLDTIDKCSHVAGDMTRFGRFYIGLLNSGALVADYGDWASAY